MNNINNISKVYFLGIGGIGMSAIARYYLDKKVLVYGYDKTPSKLTGRLEEEGAIIHYSEDIDQIPSDIDLVIYTPAIPDSNIEFQYLKTTDIPVIKRAKALGLLANDSFEIAIAGSHGKTTLTSMIAHVLVETGMETTALIGGICKNFDANYINTGDKYFVVEADEYDRSFHQLMPQLAVVTAIDNDHLEVYPTKTDAFNAFALFVNQIKQEGRLIISTTIEEWESIAPSTETIGYHLIAGDAHYRSDDLKIYNGAYHFSISGQNCVLNMGGKHNVENAIAAFAVADQLGIPKVEIANALSTFKGIERRFEYIIRTDECVLIDDYAHHPEEISQLVASVKELYSNMNIKLIFQPHLYSRTQKLAEEFAASLSEVDEVVLMDIYPARELPIDGVDSQLIDNQLVNSSKVIYNVGNIETCLNAQDEVVLIVGAGDIGTCVEKIKSKLIELKSIDNNLISAS